MDTRRFGLIAVLILLVLLPAACGSETPGIEDALNVDLEKIKEDLEIVKVKVERSASTSGKDVRSDLQKVEEDLEAIRQKLKRRERLIGAEHFGRAATRLWQQIELTEARLKLLAVRAEHSAGREPGWVKNELEMIRRNLEQAFEGTDGDTQAMWERLKREFDAIEKQIDAGTNDLGESLQFLTDSIKDELEKF
jgi:hypothetical protein